MREKPLTVGDLRDALRKLPSDMPLTVFVPSLCNPMTPEPYQYNVIAAELVDATGISPENFELTLDEGFRY